MASTQITGRQIADGSIERSDINISAAGKALIRKLIVTPSTGITISSYTGADSGTGDVTLAIDTNTIATRAWVQAQGYLTSDSYVSNVQLLGNSLKFTGVGNGFGGSVDLSTIIPTESDTLATVTSRGASTSTPVTFNGNVTLGNNADLIFQDLAGVFPTTGKGFDWTLNNDGARIYAIQPSSDSIDFVFQLRDNATTNDRFVFWVQEWRGAAYDKYPLIIRGGTEFDLVDSSLFIRGTQVITNGRNLQNVSGNISMFTNDSGYITAAALNGYATQTYVNTQVANLVDSAPGTLDTLNELAAALGDDPNFATTVTNSIATKVPQTRTLTINGVSYDLSANRSWTISTADGYISNVRLTGSILEFTGIGSAFNGNIDLNQLGYLTSFTETDPTVPAHVKSITTTEKSNWNTAYSWGNHATAGYQPASTAITTSNIGSQSVNYANSAGSSTTTLRGIVEDTRGGQRTPTDYDDYRVSWEFTNQIPGLNSGASTWWSAMTIQGWHDGYAAWQIIGPASSAVEDFYLRSGNNATWNTSRRIWHSGDFTSTNVSNWNTAYSWGNHASAGYATQTWVQSQGYLTSVSDVWVNTSGDTMTGNLTMSGNNTGIYFTGGNNRIYFSGYRAFEGNAGGNLQIGEGYTQTQFQSSLAQFDGNIYVSNNGGNIHFDRPGGATVGALGWHTDDIFYVAGHPNYGPGAGNSVRLYAFGSNLHLGSNGLGDIFTMNSAGKISINTLDTNSDKSDFTVFTGGDTTIALSSSQFRIGDTDVNWSVALRQSGTLHTYGQSLNLGTAAGNYAVNMTPNGVTAAQFYEGYTYFPGLDLSISRINGAHSSNYFRGDASHFVLGTGGTLYLNYAHTSGTTYIFGNTYINSNIVWHAGNDGAGSGLDADLLDGQQGSYYFSKDNMDAARNIVSGTNLDTDLENGGAYSSYGAGGTSWNAPFSYGGVIAYAFTSGIRAQFGFDIRHTQSDYGDLWYRTKNNVGYSTWRKMWHSGNFTDNSANWNTAYSWGNHAGLYIPINPDTDGPAWSYSDENPTINGTYIGGRQAFGADGDSLTGGALQARLLNAYDGHVNSAYGYYVGNLNYGGDSGTHTTTQVIDSAGRWVGTAIADNKIASSSNWNTAYGWGNHASQGYATQSWVQSQGYITSVSDVWVNTSGDTMTGSLRFNEGSGFGRVAYLDNYHGMILRGIPSDAAGNVTVGDYTSLIQHSGDFRFYRTNGSINELYFQVNASAAYWRGNTIWHSGNDGAGSGLDADLLDGFERSASGGGDRIAQYASNGYLYVNNWIHPANGTGLFYDSGPHFYESGGQMYSSHALRVNANILITDGTDNNRFTKGSNFLNLRDPWNNLHMQINSGGGMYFDAGHFYLRRPDGGTNWLYLDGSNYNVYVEQHNYARVTFRYNTDRYAQSWYNSTTGAYWWVTTDAGQLGLHRNGDGDKFYFSNGGDFYSTTNGWLSTALAGKSNTGHTHDDRYYTESESDSRFVNVDGDTMTGTLYAPRVLLGSGTADNYIGDGGIRIGRTDTDYTQGTSWSGTRSTMFIDCQDVATITIHDSGHRLVEYMTYSGGGTNIIYSGRDIGWGTTNWYFGADITVNGTITENSSIRYKENVKSLEYSSEAFAKLNPVRYNKKGSGVEEIGLIAEDVAALYPEVVKYDKDGNPDGVNYTRLSAILIKAVQELTDKVNQLEKNA